MPSPRTAIYFPLVSVLSVMVPWPRFGITAEIAAVQRDPRTPVAPAVEELAPRHRRCDGLASLPSYRHRGRFHC